MEGKMMKAEKREDKDLEEECIDAGEGMRGDMI